MPGHWIRAIALTLLTVLLLGPSGVGQDGIEPLPADPLERLRLEERILTRLVERADRDEDLLFAEGPFGGYLLISRTEVERDLDERVADGDLSREAADRERETLLAGSRRTGAEVRSRLAEVREQIRRRGGTTSAPPFAGFVWADRGKLFLLPDGARRPRRLVRAPKLARFPVFSPGGERVAFVAVRDPARPPATREFDLCVLGVDDENLQRVAPLTGYNLRSAALYNSRPTWSPDGRWLCFPREGAEGGLSLWVVPADGSAAPRRITGRSGVHDAQPSWSPRGPAANPDGTLIAFSRSHAGTWPRGSQIWTVDPAVGEASARQLYPTTRAAAGAAALMPRWSPDGRRIAFLPGAPRGGLPVRLLDPVTGETERATWIHPTVVNPVWSPRGLQVAFAIPTSNEEGLVGVWRKNLNGPHMARRAPVMPDFDWSPAGRDEPVAVRVPDPATAIAFVRDRSVGALTPGHIAGGPDVWLMDPDGEVLLNITKTGGLHDAEERHPCWSPDRTRIVVSSNHRSEPPGWFHLYTMDPDGSDVVRLTEGRVIDTRPVWSPDGRTIAFLRGRGREAGLRLIDPDGSNLRRVPVDGPIQGYQISWSPDSRRIAFDAGGLILAVDLSSGELTRLSPEDAACHDPAWSTDTGVLAAIRDYENPESSGPWQDLVLLDGNGGGQVARLTSERYYRRPTWSPVPNEILVESGGRIFGVSADGTERGPLPADLPDRPAANCIEPAFGPGAPPAVPAPTPTPGSRGVDLARILAAFARTQGWPVTVSGPGGINWWPGGIDPLEGGVASSFRGERAGGVIPAGVWEPRVAILRYPSPEAAARELDKARRYRRGTGFGMDAIDLPRLAEDECCYDNGLYKSPTVWVRVRQYLVCASDGSISEWRELSPEERKGAERQGRLKATARAGQVTRLLLEALGE